MVKKLIKIILILLLVFITFYVVSYGIAYYKAINNGNGETYLACGCGCCGGTETIEQCLYRSKGDNLNQIIMRDIFIKKIPTCSAAGCSLGTLYRYCD